MRIVDVKYQEYLREHPLPPQCKAGGKRWGFSYPEGKVPFPVLQIITYEDVGKRMKEFSGPSLLYEARDRLSEADRELRDLVNKKKEETALTDREKVFLMDVREFSKSKLLERYRRCGLNSYQGRKTVVSLERKGFIEVIDVPTRKGRERDIVIIDKNKSCI